MFKAEADPRIVSVFSPYFIENTAFLYYKDQWLDNV
jgi:hypothetical protein